MSVRRTFARERSISSDASRFVRCDNHHRHDRMRISRSRVREGRTEHSPRRRCARVWRIGAPPCHARDSAYTDSMQAYVVHTTVVLDRRVEPLITWIRELRGEITAEEVRRLAACLREVRPAWRAIAVTAAERAAAQLPGPDTLPRDPLLRLDLVLRSTEPLIEGSAATVADARAKLEALTSFSTPVPVMIETAITPTDLAWDRSLLVIDHWPEHWYCECGQPVIMELGQCPRCGRPRRRGAAWTSSAPPMRAAA